MTQTLLITTDNRDPYDLLNGVVRITSDTYYENTTRDGLLERRYLLVGKAECEKTDIALIEAVKEIQAYGRIAAEWQARPFERSPVWLVTSTTDEAIYQQSVVVSIQVTLRVVNGLGGPMLEDNMVIADLVIVTMRNRENVLSREVSADSVNVFGGTMTFDGAGNAEGRVERLTVSPTFGDYVYNAWIGIRSVNDGVEDFSPVIPFSVNPGGSITGVTKVTDANAYNGEAIQVDHSSVSVSDELTLRHLTSISLAYPSANYSHYNGRYRAVLRYRIAGTTALIAFKGYYGTVGLNARTNKDSIPLETVYLSGTNNYYRLIDIGEVTLPYHGRFVEKDVLGLTDGCSFAFATEFINGTVGTDHFVADAIALVPADRLGTCEELDYVFTPAHWLTTEHDTTKILGQYGIPINGVHALSTPSDGGVVVVVVENQGVSFVNDTVGVTMVIRDRYQGFAGNG